MPNPIRGDLAIGHLPRLMEDRYSLGGQEPGPGRVPGRPTAAGDRLEISAGARSLSNMLRTWDALAVLFGRRPQGGIAPPMPDLAALRETLAEARQNLETARTRNNVTEMLKSSALQQAEALVEEAYGLKGDGAPLKVVYEEDMGHALAAVSFQYDSQGRMTNQHLHLSLSEFIPDYSPNGKNDHVIENDRIIAHELTHAVMGRNMDMKALPEWFAEGTAEYVSGAAERVGRVLKQFSPQQLMNRLAQPWQNDSSQYAAGYLAVRYLDDVTRENGGIKAIMGELKDGASLDDAIHTVSDGQFADSRSFVRHMVEGAGVAFIKTLDLSGRDPGSFKPARGPDVVPDNGTRSNQPLKGFRIQWPHPLDGLTYSGWAAAAYQGFSNNITTHRHVASANPRQR